VRLALSLSRSLAPTAPLTTVRIPTSTSLAAPLRVPGRVPGSIRSSLLAPALLILLTLPLASMAVGCSGSKSTSLSDLGASDAAPSGAPIGDTEDTTGNPTAGDAATEAGAQSLPSGTDSGSAAALALSDGFESAAVGGPPSPTLWTISQPDCTGTGTLAVDDSQAHTGTHSVRVNGGGGYCDHIFFANAAAVASVGKEIYVRFFVRLNAALDSSHVTFMSMLDQNDSGNYLRMGGQDGILMYNRQSDDATLPTMSPTGVSDSVMPAMQTWVCVESHIDETLGTIDTWVDGNEIPGLVEDGTAVPDISTQWLAKGAWKPSLQNVRFGWESYSGETMTLWFDDVAVAAQRIGCGS
jgi:hypothetical protein